MFVLIYFINTKSSTNRRIPVIVFVALEAILHIRWSHVCCEASRLNLSQWRTIHSLFWNSAFLSVKWDKQIFLCRLTELLRKWNKQNVYTLRSVKPFFSCFLILCIPSFSLSLLPSLLDICCVSGTVLVMEDTCVRCMTHIMPSRDIWIYLERYGHTGA